jgi:hypothetical protein
MSKPRGLITITRLFWLALAAVLFGFIVFRQVAQADTLYSQTDQGTQSSATCGGSYEIPGMGGQKAAMLQTLGTGLAGTVTDITVHMKSPVPMGGNPVVGISLLESTSSSYSNLTSVVSGTVQFGDYSEHDFTVTAASSYALNPANYYEISIYAPGSVSPYIYGSTDSNSYANGTNHQGNADCQSGAGLQDMYFVISGTLGNFYAQITNTINGRWLLRSTPASSTDSNFIKRLPEDWAVYVSSTLSASGTPIIADGYRWYDVVDPTDGVEGWMAGANASGTLKYLPFPTSTSQEDLAGSASTTISASTTRADVILEAVDHYYNNSSTDLSLYSSDNGTNNLSMLKERGYLEKVILGIAAQETGGVDLNNEIVSKDYGHGIMQITPYGVFAHEPTSTGDWIYNTENLPTNGSYLVVYPCATQATSTYRKCYTEGGTGSSNAKPYKPYEDDPSITYKYYANTEQSIYANVKDGLRVLQEKYGNSASSTPTNRVCDYTSSTVTVASTTYSCLDREIVLVTAAFNGTSTYLGNVANKLSNIQNYFSNQTSSDITDMINKLDLANASSVYVQLHSPGDLSIQDSEGRIIGIVNGEVRNDFPFASYDRENKSAHIFFAPSDNLTYKVVGTGTGEYGLDVTITDGNQRTAFRTRNVSLVPNEVHTYTIDQDAILKDQNGVTLRVDKQGDGTIDKVEVLSATITVSATPPPIRETWPSSPHQTDVDLPINNQ